MRRASVFQRYRCHSGPKLMALPTTKSAANAQSALVSGSVVVHAPMLRKESGIMPPDSRTTSFHGMARRQKSAIWICTLNTKSAVHNSTNAPLPVVR